MLEANLGSYPGKRGATAASWSEKNPRVLVKAMWEKYPHADDAELCRRVQAALETRGWLDFLPAFIDHTTKNCLLAIKAEDRRSKSRARKKRPKKSANATAIINRLKKIVLMEMPTPFGKSLGDCNEVELRQMGGWVVAVADGVGRKHLRDVKSESDLRNAFIGQPLKAAA